MMRHNTSPRGPRATYAGRSPAVTIVWICRATASPVAVSAPACTRRASLPEPGTATVLPRTHAPEIPTHARAPSASQRRLMKAITRRDAGRTGPGNERLRSCNACRASFSASGARSGGRHWAPGPGRSARSGTSSSHEARGCEGRVPAHQYGGCRGADELNPSGEPLYASFLGVRGLAAGRRFSPSPVRCADCTDCR